MKSEVSMKQGYFCEINIEDLGEFKFLFSENENITPGTDKFFVECFWNPPNYGLVDHIVGYYCEDIKKEMEKITDENGMDYFIDGARVSCLCRIESGHDDEGVYEGILDEWFGGYDSEDERIGYCHYDKDDNEDTNFECDLNCYNIECENCEYYYSDEDDFRIVATEDFNKYYEHYGYLEFTKKVLRQCDNRKEYKLNSKVTLIDAEPSKRIYFKNENGNDFIIRYNICSQDENEWRANYTLYKDGNVVSEGIASAWYVNINNNSN